MSVSTVAKALIPQWISGAGVQNFISCRTTYAHDDGIAVVLHNTPSSDTETLMEIQIHGTRCRHVGGDADTWDEIKTHGRRCRRMGGDDERYMGGDTDTWDEMTNDTWEEIQTHGRR